MLIPRVGFWAPCVLWPPWWISFLYSLAKCGRLEEEQMSSGVIALRIIELSLKNVTFLLHHCWVSVFVNWIIETLGAKLSGTIESFDTLTTANYFLYLLPNHSSYTKCYYGQYLAFIKSPSHKLDGQYVYFLTYLCWMNMQ